MRLCARQGSRRTSSLRYAICRARWLDGTIDFARLARQSDEAIIERLSSVRGIGTWTAEMFLMFELRRMDVWPVDDLGVRQGYGLAWGIDPPPTPKQLLALGERFRPYRSIVARYCWEAVALSAAEQIPACDRSRHRDPRAGVPSRGRWTAEMASGLTYADIGI